jgi:hypothetical protein
MQLMKPLCYYHIVCKLVYQSSPSIALLSPFLSAPFPGGPPVSNYIVFLITDTADGFIADLAADAKRQGDTQRWVQRRGYLYGVQSSRGLRNWRRRRRRQGEREKSIAALFYIATGGKTGEILFGQLVGSYRF